MDQHYYEQQTSKRDELLNQNRTTILFNRNGTQNIDECQSIQNYKKLRVIGRGAYGLCSLYQDKTSILNQKVVIKSVSLECRSQSERSAILCMLLYLLQ